MSAPAWAQAAAGGKQWEFYGSVFGYLVPEEGFYASPVLTADRRSLHLEARYNYENLETGSLWIGRNFSSGSTVTRLALDTQGEVLFRCVRSGKLFLHLVRAQLLAS